MLDANTSSLVSVRFDQARECLRDAELLLVNNSLKASANRSYYCIFHAMRAVLAIDRFDSKKHSGIISHFRQYYIKTGIFPSLLSDFIEDTFNDRNDCDYMDFYVISKDDATAHLENAKAFLKSVEEYLGRIVPEIKNVNKK